MAAICLEAEKSYEVELDKDFLNQMFTRVDQSVANGALFTAWHLKTRAIAALTDSGSTALWMSRHNIDQPIFALTPNLATRRKLALYRNVQTFDLAQGENRDEVLAAAEGLLLEKGLVARGELIVLTVGEPMGKPGGTNTIKIVKVGQHLGASVASHAEH
jgi:pyruvate kinase